MNMVSSFSHHQSPLAFFHVRTVQFQRTTEMNVAFNRGDHATATKWITKSTKEFDSEVVKKGNTIGILKHSAATPQKKIDDALKEAEMLADLEVQKIFDFKKGRVDRYKDFFKRHGIFFAALYFSFYFGGLFFFWFLLHNKIVDKHSLFEIMYAMSAGYLEREPFFHRVEEWGDYIDFGFAFTLNELADVVRIPFTLTFFYAFKRFLAPKTAKGWRPGLFSRNSPTV